jgi:hypothetical protein
MQAMTTKKTQTTFSEAREAFPTPLVLVPPPLLVTAPAPLADALEGVKDPGEYSNWHSWSRLSSSPRALVTVMGGHEKPSGVSVSVTVVVVVVTVWIVYPTIEVLVIRQLGPSAVARGFTEGAPAPVLEEVVEMSVGGG